MKTNELDKQRIRGLIIKGFGKEEIIKITSLKEGSIQEVIESMASDTPDISKNSVDLYSELQKDLAKLVMLETGKEKRDAGTILSAIKLQAELQDKKLQLQSNRGIITDKISKRYITERDKEILKEYNINKDFDAVAKKFGIGKSSVSHAIDRATLEIPEDIQDVSPSIISETRGLDKDTRIKMIRDYKKKKMNRKEIRNMVTKIKNKIR